MTRKKRGSGRKGAMTSGDYARMIGASLVILFLLAACIGAAFWAGTQYDLRELLQIPYQVPDMAIPIGLGLGAWVLLMGIVTVGFAPFFRSPKDDVDEYGMYKHHYDD